MESGEVFNPEQSLIQTDLTLTRFNYIDLENDVEDASITKVFLDMISVYCNVLENYPELLLQIHDLVSQIKLKEEKIQSMKGEIGKMKQAIED